MEILTGSKGIKESVFRHPGFALCLLFLSMSAHAEGWKIKQIAQADPTVALCSAEAFNSNDPAKKVIQFTQADATINLCYDFNLSVDSATLKSDKYRSSYEVNYALQKQASPSILHADDEMMAWPMSYAIYKDSLVFWQYWGTRKVKKHTFYCGKECHLKTQCRAERLASDVPNIVASVQPFMKTADARARFLLSEDSSKNALLDQLFITAGMGDDKAMKTLHDLAQGMDAAAGEIIGTFIDYAADLRKEKCSWE